MIHIWLKDGTELRCNIYETGESGEYPIADLKEIDKKLNRRIKKHENFKEGLIPFQTEMINGKFHVNNVMFYEVIQE